MIKIADAEKAFGKIKHPLDINSQQIRTEFSPLIQSIRLF